MNEEMDDKALTKVLICGERCVGKTTLMWGLQKELGWPVFSASQFLVDFIKQLGLRGKRDEIKQHHRNISDEIDSRVRNLIESEYKVIIEARAFRYIKEPFELGLKVLLTAEDVVRFKRSSERERTEYARAAKRIQKRDEEFRINTGKIFGFFDMFSPEYYDVVIDTSTFTPEQVMQEVLARVKT